MGNLFSVFEPSAALGLSLNWVAAALFIAFLPSLFWARPSSPNQALKELKSSLNLEFSAILGSSSAPGLTLIPVALTGFILLNNFLGLFPFIFTSSSHLTFTVSLALPLWVGHMALGIAQTPNSMLAHLVPMGTPPVLMPFMVLIELVSSTIRPLTLAVRLAANMVAGHLLLTLLGNQAPNSSVLVIAVVLFSLFLLTVLETAVAMIQAYVFSVLSTLYFNEVNSPAISYTII